MEKILVVDDQRNMRTTLAIMLRGAGYVVDEAADGEKGAELGAAGAYDLVITDLRMGASSGIDVLRAVKKSFALTEVIVMTAYGTIESAVEAMRLGAHDYIQKPFDADAINLIVGRVPSSCHVGHIKVGRFDALAECSGRVDVNDFWQGNSLPPHRNLPQLRALK